MKIFKLKIPEKETVYEEKENQNLLYFREMKYT